MARSHGGERDHGWNRSGRKKQRLQNFLESKSVASLNLGDRRTGTLRDVEARTLTDYLASGYRNPASNEIIDIQSNSAARQHHGRLVSNFEKAQDYSATARELITEGKNADPQFLDKERINLDIYAERQDDDATREQFLA